MEYIAICNVVKQSSTGSFERDALDQTVIDCEKSLLQSVFLLENIIDNIRSQSSKRQSTVLLILPFQVYAYSYGSWC